MQHTKLLGQLQSWLHGSRPLALGRRHARRLLDEVRLRDPLVYRTLAGPLAGGRESLSLHYLGRGRFAQDFLVFFERHDNDANIAQTTRRQTSLPGFVAQRRTLRGAPHDADLLVVDQFLLPPSPAAKSTYLPFVDASLAVQPTIAAQLAEVRSRGHRRKLQGALKRGFAWRKTHDLADFARFYEQMYAPFVRQRFQFDRSVVPRQQMEKVYAQRGFLLLLEDEGQPVAGAMMYIPKGQPRTLAYWKYGLADAASLTPAVFGERNGCTEAMVLRYAVEQGFASIDFGLTRALAGDGIFAHKRRLGCDFRPPADAPARFALHLPRRRRAALCASQPLLAVQRGALVCWLGHRGPLTPAAAESLTEQLRGACFPSLAALELFVADCPSGDAKALRALAHGVGREAKVRVSVHDA